MINTLSDVLGLLVVADEYRAAFVVDAIFGIVVADAFENIAGKADVVNVGIRGNFTGKNNQSGGAEGLRGNAAQRILLQAGVKNGIRNLVGHFVRMTFTDGFGCKKIFAGHSPYSKICMNQRQRLTQEVMDKQSVAQTL